MPFIATLEPLAQATLRLNCALPYDVCDEHGRVLVRLGTPLNEDHLSMLGGLALYRRGKNRYEYDDGPSADVADLGVEVMRQLAERQPGDAMPVHEKRQHVRRQWMVDLSLDIETPVDGGVRRSAIRVTTKDLSAGGIAFLCDQFIEVDTVIVSTFPSLRGRPTIKGVVRSCIQTDDGKYRVGVQFTQKL